MGEFGIVRIRKGCSMRKTHFKLFGLTILVFFSMLACAVFSEGATAQPDFKINPTDVPRSVTLEPAVKTESPSPDAPAAQADPTVAPVVMEGDYQIGSPVYIDLYLSPSGSDDAGNPGTDVGQPLRSLTEAWARLPVSTTSTGYRLNLLPGIYPCEPLPEDVNNCINYYADRWGTYEYPIVIQAVNGQGSVTIRGGLNFNNIRYVYLLNLDMRGGGPLPTNVSGNNLLHIERGDHVLLRGLSVLGPNCNNDTCNNLQEVLKVNQTQHLYVENSVIGGAWHSSVDYFVVQYGHFLNNEIHTAGQWCMYIKGGSAYLNIAGNEFHDCQLGFQSGQSANLAVMRTPWFHYETYGIKFVNNLLHDIPGVGLSAAGAYNTLFAYNTLYRVGISTDPGYPLVGMTFGERNCTPIDEIPNVIANCPLLVAAGAWGPAMETISLQAIPNRYVYVYNNLFYNPAPFQTLYTQFDIPGPITVPAGFQNIPSPTRADDNLVIAGNVIWNGPESHPLGVEDPGLGCEPTNPTCNLSQLIADNAIHTIEPAFINPGGGNYHLKPASLAALNGTAKLIPDFIWDGFSPSVPVGDLSNQVNMDRAGLPRLLPGVPGAYASPAQGHVFIPLLWR